MVPSSGKHSFKSQTMERDILVSFFNSRAFQSVAKKVCASRTATESVNAVLPRNKLQSLPTKSNASDSRF